MVLEKKQINFLAKPPDEAPDTVKKKEYLKKGSSATGIMENSMIIKSKDYSTSKKTVASDNSYATTTMARKRVVKSTIRTL
mmetsp:Transcript_373/g.317  ORF Transcript_373/g.317 Transcript_373/m.317 type:complete len:81 (+) Transcript_373:786-1028(+)